MAVFKHVDFEVPQYGELASGPVSWASYQQAVMNLEPMAYWRLSEAAGESTAKDEMGFIDGTIVGSPSQGDASPIARTSRTSLYFDTGQYVQIGSATDFNFQSGEPYTLMAWVKPNVVDGNIRPILKKGAEQWVLQQNKSSWVTSTYSGGTWYPAKDSTTVVAGQWYFLAGTYDGSNLNLYVNGLLAAGPVTAPLATSSDAPRIASDSSGLSQSADMSIVEAAIFAKALIAAEMVDLYHRGTGSLVLNG